MKRRRLLAILEAETITGPAKNLLQFAQVARDRMEVSVAVYERGRESTVFRDRAKELSIPVHSIPEVGRFDRAVIQRLVALVKEIKPDLIQTHAVKSHFLARLGGLGEMAPWIAFHHGYTWQDWRVRGYNQLDRWSLRAPRQVVTMSRPFAKELARMGVPSRRIAIVHNAIDPDWGRAGRSPEAAGALRARWGVGAGKPVILIVGRLSREKDHQTLLEALADLRKSGDGDAHLLVVGDGPERTAIKAAIHRLGLAGAVTLTGQVASAEPYYGIADICVLSSLSEGSPNALLEAMAARLPVVATAVGGIPEMVVNGESALLIPPRSTEAMRVAIGRLLTDGPLSRRLVAAAHQRALENYAPAQRAKRLLELYAGLPTA